MRRVADPPSSFFTIRTLVENMEEGYHILYQGSYCEKWTGRVSNTAGTKGMGVTME